MIINILGGALSVSLGVTKAILRQVELFSLALIFITHERALSSGPMIRPSGQMPRGVKSSSIHTRSPVLMISSGCDQFVRRMSVGAYSFTSRRQKQSIFSFTNLQDFTDSLLVGWSLKAAEGVYTKGLPRTKWFGVNGRSSAISLFTCVNGRPFKIPSVSATIVMKRSRERRADPRFRRKTRLIIWTSLSHTPPPPPPQVRSRRKVHFPADILIM